MTKPNEPVMVACYRIHGAGDTSVLVEPFPPGGTYARLQINFQDVLLDLDGVVALRDALQRVSGLAHKGAL